ncbi:transposase [Thalassorhabdus alkalitolerans]|uniref:Transposase n=1 Tax=Thalassorhabdus alkalitolerans TaxID=2282697 RepID=A0ABW0YRN4_9BACI|nr:MULTISPECIES: transposase [Bacillaceae]
MKRTRYSNEFKCQVVKEAMKRGNQSWVARKYVISVGLVNRWIVEYQEGKLVENKER